MRVLLASPWIPGEWVRAHGLAAHDLGTADEFPRLAPALAAGVCSFAERAVRLAETRPNTAVIFPTTCDQLRRSFDAARFHGAPRTFLFNLPATTSPAAWRIYREEVDRLGRFLVAQGGTTPTPELLRDEMAKGARGRASQLAAARAVGVRPDLVPLALVGGPVSRVHDSIFTDLAAAGAQVVLDATENGERTWEVNFDSDGGAAADPVETLASGYFKNIVDVFQRPNTCLYDWLRPRLADRRARGILLWHFTGCDLWRAEAQSLREKLNLPVLLVEAPEGGRLAPRELTRVEAFVETLR